MESKAQNLDWNRRRPKSQHWSARPWLCLSVTFIVMIVALAALAGPATNTAQPLDIPAVRCQIWHNVSGDQITDTLATSDLDRPADETRSISTLELSPGLPDEYACSLSALVTAPVTGWFKFNIGSRDAGLVLLSTDESSGQRRFICETPASTDLHSYKLYSAQTSDPIKLIAGQRYFIQALFKSGGGPGCVSIAWTLPNGTFQSPIPADRLTAFTGDVTAPSWRVQHVAVSLKPDSAPATQPGIHRYIRNALVVMDGKSADLSYLMSLPNDYFTTTDAKPMLIFLHGNNRQGYSTLAIDQTGPIHDMEKNPALRDWMPMIVLCPQLPPDWRWDSPGVPRAVNELVEQLCQRHSRIDRKRIYITGLSMGGKGTWLTLEDSPQTYAAAAPMSAVDIRPDLAPAKLKDIANIQIACGSLDGGFALGSHRMFEALKPALGQRVQLTVFNNEGHNVWSHYYPNQAFYEGLLKFSK